jgi:hypothetical protein
MIELGKKYQTRDGREVRIYAVDGGGVYPVHGAIAAGDGTWSPEGWTDGGSYIGGDGQFDEDLIEAPKVYEGWINVDRNINAMAFYVDEALAHKYACPSRIACIHVKFTAGEGL